ncbi:MAG: hypothetical protein RLZZ617_771 [Bacteroidota bacterium]|jgi:hypothetical protein
MKQSNHLIAQLNYWADCIEMLGPDDQPMAGLFEQPMAGLKLVRKPQAHTMAWAQKIARKTKAPAQGLL